MIADSNYYVTSLILVIVMSVTRDFFIPSIIWHNYLKDKSYTYRFFFCIIIQATIQINVVLFLGLLDICNRFTLILSNLLIYILIIWNYSDKKFYQNYNNFFNDFLNASKQKRVRNFIINKLNFFIKTLLNRIFKTGVWHFIKDNIFEILMLAIISIYNIWFFSYNVLNYHSYQFSDIPVHQSWIYDLEKGVLFSKGIYPFGMHAMIYFIREIFRYDLREILLYAGAYQTVILTLVMYLLAKEIFKGKYSPMAALLVFSMVINQGRYSASLPQEFGMYAVMAMAFFLIKYLHKEREILKIQGDSIFRRFFRINAYINRKYFDDYLVFFMLSVALIINYHFYTAIAAIFLVFSIILAFLPRALKRQYLIPILLAGILGGIIAVLPTGIALAKGIPFQESMTWATTVMRGEEWPGSDANYLDSLNEALGSKNTEEIDENNDENTRTKIDYSSMNVKEILLYFYKTIYGFVLGSMAGSKATRLMFNSMFISAILGGIMFLFKESRIHCYDYLSIIFYIFIITILGASALFGIPEIIASTRASTFIEPFIGLLHVMPIDIFFRLLAKFKNKRFISFINKLSFITCLGLGFLIMHLGFYHSFFEVNQAYYNESEYVLRNIKKTYEKYNYTIVATTDEYYEVIDHGRHTELSRFVNMIDKNEEEFIFPTKYVFFFVEKMVLNDYEYGQVKVSREYADKNFVFLQDAQDYYFQRAVIQSKAYYWAKEFAKIYPRNFKVFFEDEIYVVYRLEQNVYSPFKLQINY